MGPRPRKDGVPQHGGHVAWAAERYGVLAHKFLDFSANVNPLGLPAVVRSALLESLNEIDRYPDPDASSFCRVLAERQQVPVAAVRALNGAAEGFLLLLQMWRPRRVVIPVPAFAEYERAALSVGAEVEHIPLRIDEAAKKYVLDVEAIAKRLAPGVALLLGNPNNPTGQSIEPDELAHLCELVRQTKSHLLIDEAFLDFLPDNVDRSLSREAVSDPHIAVIGSLTKMYAFPGLRLGFVVASPEWLMELDRLRQPWPVNHLALVAGEVALRDAEAHVARTRSFIQQERSWMVEQLSRFPGIVVWHGSVNFLLLELQPPWPHAEHLCELLGRKGILLRNASNFSGLTPSHVRIAVRKREENQRLLDALAWVVAEEREVR